jgi:hypothetical protein
MDYHLVKSCIASIVSPGRCLRLVPTLIIGALLVLPHKLPALAAPTAKPAGAVNHCRIIDFHTNQSVGRLELGHFNKNSQFLRDTKLGEARGKMLVPDGAVVQLVVNFYGANNMSFLDTLGANDLEALDLSNSGRGFELTDKDLSRLGRLTGLTLLNIEGSESGPLAMNVVSHLTGLRNLCVYNTNINDKDTAALANLTKLECLSFNHNALSDTTLSQIQKLTSLRQLVAKRCGITGAGMKFLAKLNNLQEINLSSDHIGDAGVRAIPALPQLTMLNIDDCQITPACLPCLAKLPKLSRLSICWCQPTREALETVGKFQKLVKLEISGRTCNAPNLVALQKLPHLQELLVTVTIDQQDQVRKILPGVSLHFIQNKSGVPLEIFAPTHQ